ncbi:MAG: hypothetical protein J1F33_01220 [Clostridiales bacterium]|nr:hypothetical protein [Clostridiales bacterium]
MITINQIEQIERFIAEIDHLKEHNMGGEPYYEEAMNLDKKIEASGFGYKSSITWHKTITRSLSGQGFSYSSDKINRNLCILHEALQGILNAQPYYDKLLEIRQAIYDIGNASDQYRRHIIMQVIEEYKDVIGWDNDEPIDDVYLMSYEITCKLNKYIRRLPCEFDREQLENRPSSAVNVVQNNSQVNNQTVHFSIEQSIQELDDCEKIDSEELQYIKTQLNELQKLLESKRHGNKVREKVSAILKWLADKTTDVMVAVLPALITGLKG